MSAPSVLVTGVGCSFGGAGVLSNVSMSTDLWQVLSAPASDPSPSSWLVGHRAEKTNKVNKENELGQPYA
jgi:hypothetical protein